jgi:ketosteroid isomerase-like protein
VSPQDLEIVRRSFEAFNRRDVDGLVALCDPDCEWLPFRAQLEGMLYRGHEGVRRFLDDMEEDWREFTVEPLELHELDERAMAVGRVRALGRGSGVDIDSVAGFIFELRHGKILRVTSHSDPEAALRAARRPPHGAGGGA